MDGIPKLFLKSTVQFLKRDGRIFDVGDAANNQIYYKQLNIDFFVQQIRHKLFWSDTQNVRSKNEAVPVDEKKVTQKSPFLSEYEKLIIVCKHHGWCLQIIKNRNNKNYRRLRIEESEKLENVKHEFGKKNTGRIFRLEKQRL